MNALSKRSSWAARCSVFLMLLTARCASPDPSYYALEPTAGSSLATLRSSIEIRRPGLAGYLDRSDIVLVSADYRLHLAGDTRWAEPLADMIGRVLSQDLSQRMPSASVYTEAGAISADPDWRVELDIQRFDQDAGGAVRLVAEYAVEPGRGHQPIAARHVALSAPAPSAGPGGLVAALSTLLGQLADRIAGDLQAPSPRS